MPVAVSVITAWVAVLEAVRESVEPVLVVEHLKQHLYGCHHEIRQHPYAVYILVATCRCGASSRCSVPWLRI